MRRVALVCVASVLLASCSMHGGSPVVPGGVQEAPAVAWPANIPVGVPSESLGQVTFDVALPLRNEAELDRFLDQVSDPASPLYQQFITREQFLARYGPTQSDLLAVARDLRNAGFNVSVMDQAVAAGGSPRQAERYFGTRLASAANGRLVPFDRVRLSPALSSRGATIVGLDANEFHTFSERVARSHVRPRNFHSPVGPYFTADLKEAYLYPSFSNATGAGVTMAIIISSPVKTSDIAAYLKDELIKTAPKISDVKVDGGGTYDPTTGNTLEASLDVEQTLGMAPEARDVVFNFPALYDNEIFDAYTAALKDKSVTVVNSSFGGCEAAAPLSDYAAGDNLFKQGAATGVTFVAASGDHADKLCSPNSGTPFTIKGVDWPASSPYVLAVGGTNLKTQFVAGTDDAGYISEEAFEDNLGGGAHWGSGGGYSGSAYYKRPAYQNGFVTQATRGVPDIALHMGGCPEGAINCSPDDSADVEIVGGQEEETIGTSASSPDIVGLIALATQITHKGFGDIHTRIYAASALFRRGIHGNNGYKTTGGKWDPVLGLGTPLAAYKLADASAPAGVPGTSTNP
jgi:kumamolisin